MHLGNVWAALMAWLSVRSGGGAMILRVEDLDPERSKPEFAAQLMKDLKWLGLDWDEGPDVGGKFSPYFQGQRSDQYEAAFHQLVEQGHAYPCFCTREERAAASAPHRGEMTGLYSDPCLELSTEAGKAIQNNRRCTWRLRTHAESIVFTDLNFGCQRHRLNIERDHVVLKRSDGVFAYPLAVVADDGAMGVTQVVRGSDLLESTPVQLHLMDLLGYDRPVYGHVPLLVDEAGRRLSKRQKSLDLGRLSKAGWSAEGLIGFLAWRAGFIPEFEPLKACELVGGFAWETIGKADLVISLDEMEKMGLSRK
jgi:glutamyl-tRNA synthetase